nr:heme transporter hrg1-B-like [Halyomorpha halys]
MSKVGTLCSLIFSFIGVGLGISASIVFYFYGNSMAVFWACTSACLALLNFHLHYLYFKEKLEEWHSEETMDAIKALAAAIFFSVLGIFGWFIFRIFFEHLSVYPIKDSLIITSVWTFMTAKWAFFLLRTSGKYGSLLETLNRPLLSRSTA